MLKVYNDIYTNEMLKKIDLAGYRDKYVKVSFWVWLSTLIKKTVIINISKFESHLKNY